MDDLIAGISLSPTSILNAVSKGITGGFAGLGHTVDLWIFGIAGGLLLFLLFNTHILYMLQALADWLHLSPSKGQALTHLATVGTQSHHVVNYSLWTPGAWTYNAGTGTAGGTMLHIGWTPAWAVLVGGIWVVGLVLGILSLFRGRRMGRPVMLIAPMVTGVIVFATPAVLPALLTAIWHLVDTQGLIAAIGHMIGLSASQSATWLANPFWIWGATFGVSGTHGFSMHKLLLFLPTSSIALIPQIATNLLSLTGVAGGSMTIDGAVASWIYGLLHITMILSIGMTFLLTIWTLLLFTAALWLGLSPAWIWIVALDPWSFDLARMIGGLALRAIAVQVSAWIWVAGIVLLDGGSQHGPFGLPIAFAGLTPWLSLAWTLGGIVLVWRFWIVPLWLVIRRVEVDLATWWTQTQVRFATATGRVGQHLQATGAMMTAAGVGEEPSEWGRMLETVGATLSDRSAAWADAAAWHGANLQWSERERERGAQSHIGPQDNWLTHPAGWALRETSASPPQMPSSRPLITWRAQTPSSSDDGASPTIWSATMPHAADAQFLAQETTKALQAEAERRRAEVHVRQDTNFMAGISHLPANLQEQFVAKRINDTVSNWQRSPEKAPRDLYAAMPQLAVDGNRVQIHPAPGQSTVDPSTLAHVKTVAQQVLAAQPRAITRERGGVTEVYRNGLWVAQSLHDKEGS